MEQKAARLALSKDKQVELMERFSTVTSLSDAEVKLRDIKSELENFQKSRMSTGDDCCCVVLMHCLYTLLTQLCCTGDIDSLKEHITSLASGFPNTVLKGREGRSFVCSRVAFADASLIVLFR